MNEFRGRGPVVTDRLNVSVCSRWRVTEEWPITRIDSLATCGSLRVTLAVFFQRNYLKRRPIQSPRSRKVKVVFSPR